jgi:hypothetical protein
MMNSFEFYNKCARLLNTTYDYHEPIRRRSGEIVRNRWNNRFPGNGRFPGKGIIRLFGDTVQIALRKPVSINATIEGKDAALAFLEKSLH